MPSSVVNDYIAGAVGGCAGLIGGHPIDTIKVQLQTQQHSGMLQCLKRTSSLGLSEGFFRGLAFPVCSTGLVASVFFGVYGSMMRLLSEMRGSSNHHNYLDIYIAGAVGGAAQCIPNGPIELVKVTLQSQIKTASSPHNGEYYKGPVECLLMTYKKFGIKGCYRGFSGLCVRDIPSYALYVVSYEWAYKLIMDKSWADQGGVYAGLLGGGFAGVISWGSVVPIDFVKSRLQSDTAGKYSGIIDCVIKCYRQEGIKCFLRGGSALVLRAFPVNAITFIVYKKVLDNLNSQEQLDVMIEG